MNRGGRHVIVTGGSTGIGLATVEQLLKRGYHVSAGYYGELGGLSGLAQGEHAARLVPIELDVTDVEATTSLVNHVASTQGPPYGLVTAAGIHSASHSHTVKFDDWQRVLSVNLTGTFATIRAALPHMLSEGGGRIITIASELGIAGHERNAAYCASKGGVIALTKALAREYARVNILVNCVAPGPVLTEMLKASSEYRDGSALDGMPIGRYGQPQEIAAAIDFLLDAGSFMVGQVISPNGGAVI